MKLLTLNLLIIILFVGCHSAPNDRRDQARSSQSQAQVEPVDHKTEEATWLKKLNDWGVSRYNDLAKWRVYCYYGDDSCTKGTDNRELSPTPLGFLELTLTFATLENNNLSLLYRFAYDDSTDVRYSKNRSKEGRVDEYFQPSFGVEFDLEQDTVVGYILGHGVLQEYGPKIRYENFKHPDLLLFINRNSAHLDPWFAKEAIRRGLLN